MFSAIAKAARNTRTARFTHTTTTARHRPIHATRRSSSSYWGRVSSVRWDRILGTATHIGKRVTNEDRFTCTILDTNNNISFPNVSPSSMLYCGVFDGHAGSKAAEFLATSLHKNIDPRQNDMEKNFALAFEKTERELLLDAERNDYGGGTTAAVVVLKDEKLYFANAGDTRIILCHKGLALSLSQLHVAGNVHEQSSVVSRGGHVERDAYGSPRVGGRIVVTRSIGPVRFQIPGLSSAPYVAVRHLSDDDAFLVLATDGVFTKLSNQEVCDVIKKRPTPQEGAEDLIDMCKSNADNSTVVVIRLKAWGMNNIDYSSYLKESNLRMLFGNIIDLPETFFPLIAQKAPQPVVAKKLFQIFDTHNSGELSRDDIKLGLASLGAYVSDEQIDVFLTILFRSDERVTFDTFLERCMVGQI